MQQPWVEEESEGRNILVWFFSYLCLSLYYFLDSVWFFVVFVPETVRDREIKRRKDAWKCRLHFSGLKKKRTKTTTGFFSFLSFLLNQRPKEKRKVGQERRGTNVLLSTTLMSRLSHVDSLGWWECSFNVVQRGSSSIWPYSQNAMQHANISFTPGSVSEKSPLLCVCIPLVLWSCVSEASSLGTLKQLEKTWQSPAAGIFGTQELTCIAKVKKITRTMMIMMSLYDGSHHTNSPSRDSCQVCWVSSQVCL